jgi:hypothetical protein
MTRFLSVFGAATLLTLLVTWPVAEHPTERLFGTEIAGRHADPFAAMRRFTWSRDVFTQPVTDFAGAALSRAVGPIAAYNLIVLLSFPLSAAVGALALWLAGSSIVGLWTAALIMLSPFHLAQAAYHPHVAQVQWPLLYVFAIVVWVDGPTWWNTVAVVAAALVTAGADFYAGYFGLVLTPIVAFGRALTGPMASDGERRRVRLAAAGVTAAALIGVALVHAVIVRSGNVGVDERQVAMFSARWWAYLLPAVDHPWLSAPAIHIIGEQGLMPATVEQQLFLGWTVLVLGTSIAHPRLWSSLAIRERAAVWFCLILALAAATCSFESTARLLHAVAPAFRSFARFGGFVELGAALIAGLALVALLRCWPDRGRWILAGASVAVALEYAPLPWRWRDVMPTPAHRWVASTRVDGRVIDCSNERPDADLALSIVFGPRIVSGFGAEDCSAPDLAARAVARDVTTLIVRSGTELAQAWMIGRPPVGLELLRRFPGAAVYSVTADRTAPYLDTIVGCGTREWTGGRSFCWARDRIALIVRNRSGGPVTRQLAVELTAFPEPRAVAIERQSHAADRLGVSARWQEYLVGPYEFPPGSTVLTLVPDGPPRVIDEVAHNGDRRAVSLALGQSRWLSASERQ